MPNEQPKIPARLPIIKVSIGAVLITWAHRKTLSRSLAFPLICLVALTLASNYAEDHLSNSVYWLVTLTYLIFLSIFAVICHRTVLLDSPASDSWIPQCSRRELRFLGWMVLIGIALWLTVFVVGSLIMLISKNIPALLDPQHSEWAITIFALAFIPFLYVGSRLSLIFPVVALDKNYGLQWAWEQSRNNGWRLAIVVGGLPFLFNQLLNLLERNNATIFETAILAFIGIAIFTVEVAALSLSYRELTKDA